MNPSSLQLNVQIVLLTHPYWNPVHGHHVKKLPIIYLCWMKGSNCSTQLIPHLCSYALRFQCTDLAAYAAVCRPSRPLYITAFWLRTQQFFWKQPCVFVSKIYSWFSFGMLLHIWLYPLWASKFTTNPAVHWTGICVSEINPK